MGNVGVCVQGEGVGGQRWSLKGREGFSRLRREGTIKT